MRLLWSPSLYPCVFCLLSFQILLAWPGPGGPGAKLFPFLPHWDLVPGLLSILHHQASDRSTVIRELFVAGHAVDIDDVDDRVLGAHPYLAVLCHHHTVLKEAKMEG